MHSYFPYYTNTSSGISTVWEEQKEMVVQEKLWIIGLQIYVDNFNNTNLSYKNTVGIKWILKMQCYHSKLQAGRLAELLHKWTQQGLWFQTVLCLLIYLTNK
jgi:hypothetical protein